jgi:hypothetical protein
VGLSEAPGAPSLRSALWRLPAKLAALAGLRAAPAAPLSISYLRLHEGTAFSVGIFCLPAGATIPLHNHPSMTVLSRLLYGSLHVRSLDWAPGGSAAVGGPATLTADGELRGPCDARILRPAAANLHAFTAVSACAVLDVLGPPYDAREGRDCTYYQENGEEGGDAGAAPGSAAWLSPIPPPPSLRISRAHYVGAPLRLEDQA